MTTDPKPPSPGGDTPDDNASISSSDFPTPFILEPESQIGVLTGALGEGLNCLLGKYSVATTMAYDDFQLLGYSGKTINDLDVLCIGSGGLRDIESSPTMRKRLSDFVEQGGSLVCLAAQNGYEFTALPGGEVAGYGWTEDQSCLSSAVSIVNYHQMLSGQTSINMDVNVDGYFTKWPSNATVLLQRNKNGMPALITYPFGKGTVIATTIFEDWAYGHGQSTDAGQKLIRDMVAWARTAKTLPEFAISAEVGFPLNIINSTSADAQQVVIRTIDPAGDTVKQDTITLVVPANDTIQTPYSFGTAPNTLGIWSVNYSLLTDADAIVQDDRIGQMFVISNPAGVAKTPDITYAVNSDAENYAYGSPAVFTITIWNHSDAVRNVTVHYWLPHNYWATGNTALYGKEDVRVGKSTVLFKSFEIQPNSSTVYTYSAPVVSIDRLYASFWENNQTMLGVASRGFYCYRPSCSVKVTPDKQEYRARDSVTLSIKLQNLQTTPFTGDVSIVVLNPDNVKVWESSLSVNLPYNVPVAQETGFALPARSMSGAYSVRVQVTNNGNRAGAYTANFIVPEAFLAITPNLPGVLREGDNPISFEIENTGLVAVSTGTLEAKLLNPAGSVVWADTGDINVESGLTETVNFIMPVNSLEFGTYCLAYRAQYNGLTPKEARKDLSSTVLISTSTDTSAYRIRQPISLDVGLTNNGRFQYGSIACGISLPGIGNKSFALSLNPQQNIHSPVSFDIPETAAAGQYTGTITLALPSGSTTSKNFSLSIPKSRIVMSLDSTNCVAGGPVSIKVENIGGVDAAVQCSLEVKDVYGMVVARSSQNVSLRAGEAGSAMIDIPANAVNGQYALMARAINLTAIDTTVLNKTLFISGLSATLDVHTDKQVYALGDLETALADITVEKGADDRGTVSLRVTRQVDKVASWQDEIDWAGVDTSIVSFLHDSTGAFLGLSPKRPTLPTNGLVGHWDFNENAGSVLHDVSGNGRDGVIYGALWTDNSDGISLHFNGTSDYVEVPYHASLDDPNSFTVAAWAQSDVPRSVTDGGFIVDMGYGAERRYALFIDPLGQSIGQYCGVGVAVPGVSITQWHHYTLTYDGSVLRYYVDGVLSGTANRTPGSIDDLPLRFGAQSKAIARFWKGQIDEVAIYNRELSIGEVTQLKQSSYPLVTVKYDAGRTVAWNTVTVQGQTSDSSSILMSTRTAETRLALDTAQWSTPSATIQPVNVYASGRWIEMKMVFVTRDPIAHPAVLKSIVATYTADSAAWAADLALDSMKSQSATTPIGQLEKGRYVLDGRLKSSLHQVAAISRSSFDVGLDSVDLTFSTDKAAYKSLELVTVHGGLVNGSNSDVTRCPIFFTLDGSIVYRDTLSVSAGSFGAIAFAFSAPNHGFTLIGNIDGREVPECVRVITPCLTASISAPSIAGRSPFDFVVRLANSSDVDASINVAIDGAAQSVVVPAQQSTIVQKTMTIASTTNVTVSVTGDAVLNLQQQVRFGEQVAVAVLPKAVYPEGVVAVPYSLTNTGSLDSKVDVTFTAGSQTFVRQVYVPVGKSVIGELTLNQTAGAYSIAYNSFFGSGSASYRVAQPDKVAIQLDVSRYSAPKVLILRDNTSESSLQQVLSGSGMGVTLSSVPFYQWDGTNPSPEGYDVVVLPCANYYSNAMPTAGQSALVNFVNLGGGFITTEWITYGARYSNNFAQMSDLLLFEPTQWNYNSGTEAFTSVGTHPITANLPASFYSSYYHSGNMGGLKAGATRVISGNLLPNVVAVKQQGKGRVVQFAIPGNNIGPMALSDANWKNVVLNSVDWAGKSFEGNSLRAKITVLNEGCNGFDGQLSSSTSFFAKTQDLALASGETKTIAYDLDISSVEPGTYVFKSSALHGGKTLQQATQSFVIGAAKMELSSVPTSNNFTPGQLVTLNFGVKNDGMVEGEAHIGLKFMEISSESRTAWIAPGVERQESFTFQIPDDYPDGEYKAVFALNDTIVEMPFVVSGVKLTVVASFDKSVYQHGETATLDLDIANESALEPSVYAKTSSNSDEDREDFVLGAHQVISLHIPVNEGTPSNIAYGIYMASGRAIHLNTIYIRIVNGAVTLYTDRSAYNAGETVTVHVATEETGDLSATTTTGYSNTIAVAGPTSFSFALPDEMVSGTQSINYQLGENTGGCNFDVNGYSLKVLNIALNKETYNPIDQLSANFTVRSNKAVSAVVKGWLYSEGSYTDLFEVTRDLAEGESPISVSAPMNATAAGTCKLVYGIYSSGTNLTLVTGSKAFDVKSAAILAVTTDRLTYGETDEVNVTVQTYAYGEYAGTIDIVGGGEVVASAAVALNGATDVALNLGQMAQGNYPLVARLRIGHDTASENALKVAVLDMIAPSVPVGLTLAIDGGIAGLHWSANPEPDLAGYNTYRNGGRLNAVPFKTSSFRDEGLVAGVSNAYYVTAIDKNGNESSASADVIARIDNTAPVIIMSPSGNVASSLPVTLTYSVTDDIDPSPTVDASHASGSKFSRDDIYDIRVTATDAQGNRAEKAIRINIETGAPAPVALTAYDAKVSQTIGLDWTRYDELPDVVSYRIFQHSSAFSSVDGLTPIATLANGSFVYQVSGLTNGTEYHFAVVAVDGLGNVNPIVRSVSAVPTDGKGAIKVVASVAGAKIFLGGTYAYLGAYQGIAPNKTSSLDEGPYIVQVAASGYETFYQLAEVVAGDTVTVNAELRQSAVFGYTTSTTIRASESDLNFGRAAQFIVVDWNMDGKRDLLGVTAQNDVVVYLNGNTDETPVFSSPVAILGHVEGIYSAFVVDYNNDYRNDLLLGFADGRIELLLNTGLAEDPLFGSAPVALPMTVATNAKPFVAEMNADGKKDLVVGDGSGVVKIFYNTGTDASPAFNATPDISPVVLSTANASPFVANWNRADSLKDIIAGEAGGCMNAFINVGTASAPVFDPAKAICSLSNQICLSGDAAPFVNDWNNDGLKDLLIGAPDGTVRVYLASPNVPPDADAGLNRTMLSRNIATTIIVGSGTDENTGDALTYRWLEGETALSEWRAVGVAGACSLSLAGKTMEIGEHILNLEVSDGKVSGFNHMLLTVENSPPNVVASGAGTYQYGSYIPLGGTVSDFDGDRLNYRWLNGATVLYQSTIATVKGGTPVVLPTYSTSGLGVGIHELILEVADAHNKPESSSVVIEIISTSGPTLAPVASKYMLWPPNHNMVAITVAANAASNVGPVTLSCAIFSNEPQIGKGDGGDKSPDWTTPVINQTTGKITFELRAERSGRGDGRIYTIRITAMDVNGLSTTKDVEIMVPHNE